MLKKTLVSSALALAFAAQPAMAEEGPEFDKWVAGFGQFYSPDSERPEPFGYYSVGRGIGGEFGYRFDQSWAARWEYVDLTMETDSLMVGDVDGHSLGFDVMYTIDSTDAYVFGGLRRQDLDYEANSIALGIGQHWKLSERFRLVTEAAVFRGYGSDASDPIDVGFKLGLAYAFGNTSSAAPARSKDADNDGVMDSRDMCPNTPAGQAVDATGCNNDVDNDGVMNSVDQCPNTPANTTVNSVGCPLVGDADSDGVNDDMDKCANTPSGDKVDATGCTEFTENEVSVRLNVLFANNSTVISNPTDENIVEFADFLKRYGSVVTTIEGHSSAVGAEDYNLWLSKRRAQAIVDLLVNRYGIDASRLTAVGYGETRLLNSANTAEAHRLNRRIEARVSATVTTKAEK